MSIHVSYNGTSHEIRSYDGNTTAVIPEDGTLVVEMHVTAGNWRATNQLYYSQDGTGLSGTVDPVGDSQTFRIPVMYLVSGTVNLAVYDSSNAQMSNLLTITLTKTSLSRAILDDDPNYLVDSKRRILPSPGSNNLLAVQYDNGSESVTFKAPRYQDGVDLSDKVVYINYKRPVERDLHKTPCTVISIGEDSLTFSWLLDAIVTRYAGELEFQVEISDSEGYRWQSQLGTLKILQSLYSTGLEVYTPDFLESVLQNIQGYVQQTRDSTSDAEAFSVGTRNGVAVTNQDPAYSNNAKYYSQMVMGEASEQADLSDCDIRVGYSISSSTGSVSSAAKYTSVVTFIPVTAGTVIKKGDLVAYVVYFSAAYKESIVSYAGSTTSDYIAPGDGFVRITAKNASGSEAPTVADIVANIKVLYPNTIKKTLLGLSNALSLNSVLENKFVYYSSGVVDSGRFFNLTQPIDVDSSKNYYFSIAHEGSSASYCAIFAYDENGDYVRSGYNNGYQDTTNYASYYEAALEASGSLFKVFRFDPSIKKVAILYHKYETTEISFKTAYEADLIARQEILKLRADLNDLSKRCYITEKSNPFYVQEIIGVADSYYAEGGKSYTENGETKFYMKYGYNTVLSNTYNGEGGIDCSAYIGLVLRGIHFEDTEYYTDPANATSPETDEDDGTDVETLDERVYSYGANAEYDWAINPYDYELPSVIHGHEDDPRKVRSAAQLGQWLQMMGRSVWIDKHLANLLPGDVVFFAKKYASGKWVQEPRFMHISHVAIVAEKEPAPADATWDTELYPYKHTLYEVRGASPQHPGACGKFVLENPAFSGPTENGVDTLVLVCRPDLGRITPEPGL